MKHIFFVILCFFSINFIYAENYEPNTIIVKFKANSRLADKWISSDRTLSFEEFDFILGENRSAPFIDDKLLKAVEKAKKKNMLKTANFSSNNLNLIAKIKYTSQIDAEYAASKIRLIDGIEYAEPEYIKNIFTLPNDSLLLYQYYIGLVKAVDAWEYINSERQAIVGVVDTGIDYLHPDIAENIFINEGEAGVDDLGNDKKNNGIDDDGNGFVDDWIGWDFYDFGDNNPLPGHEHGTHVGGTVGAVINNAIGIAGVAKNVKLLAVKIAADHPLATSIVNGYQGILYAAAMGADVINCSWGNNAYSQAEADIIAEATGLGALIAAAAGNDNRNAAHYPSSYNGVLSVAATDSEDQAAYFTNHHNSVDISAPGVSIMATVPNNEYRSMSGTSMASPIVAAVAAMLKNKYPEKSGIVVGEILKATADNIDSLNPYYKGLIGTGRVNALRAMSDTNLISIVIPNHQVMEEVADKEFLQGELVDISFALQNILKPAKNIYVKLIESKTNYFEMIVDSIYIGSLNQSELLLPDKTFSFKIKKNIGYDKVARLILQISADRFKSENYSIDITISPSYKTMKGNNIYATLSNKGTIGYNDYPQNSQGVGLGYKNSRSGLFESALMLYSPNKNLYNVARSDRQMVRDSNFLSNKPFVIKKPGLISNEDGSVRFYTVEDLGWFADIDVAQNVYQFAETEMNSSIIPIYTIYNKSQFRIDSVFLGYYIDWDIDSPSKNRIWWDSTNNIGLAEHTEKDTLPKYGVFVLSDHRDNFFAIDNGGMSDENPGVYDGFTKTEKKNMLSGGIGRKESSITDCSMVISAGPFSIEKNDSAKIAFVIVANENINEILKQADYIRRNSDRIGIEVNNSIKNTTHIASVYPNPSSGEINMKLFISDEDEYSIAVYDQLGKKVSTLAENLLLKYGKHYLTYKLFGIASGQYHIVLSNAKKSYSYPIIFTNIGSEK